MSRRQGWAAITILFLNLVMSLLQSVNSWGPTIASPQVAPSPAATEAPVFPIATEVPPPAPTPVPTVTVAQNACVQVFDGPETSAPTPLQDCFPVTAGVPIKTSYVLADGARLSVQWDVSQGDLVLRMSPPGVFPPDVH